MVLQIRNDDALNLAAIKYIFDELVFAPVDSLLELVDKGKLSKPAAYSATLSILNSVPEFVARCHGEKGSSPSITDWEFNGKKYLYVYGIYKLDLISEEIMITSNFEDHAGFLYDKLRGDIAHSILSGSIMFLPSKDIGGFGFNPKECVDGNWSNEVGRIVLFTCDLPNYYLKMREGVEKYIAKVESGTEKLHLENAKSDFMYAPGFTGTLESVKGFVGMLETIHKYFPESKPSR